MFVVDDPTDPRLPDSLSTHVMTGVDKLHKEGWSGEGIKIGMWVAFVNYHWIRAKLRLLLVSIQVGVYTPRTVWT